MPANNILTQPWQIQTRGLNRSKFLLLLLLLIFVAARLHAQLLNVRSVSVCKDLGKILVTGISVKRTAQNLYPDFLPHECSVLALCHVGTRGSHNRQPGQAEWLRFDRSRFALHVPLHAHSLRRARQSRYIIVTAHRAQKGRRDHRFWKLIFCSQNPPSKCQQHSCPCALPS